MGFKFGAFLGGLSQTVAERVKEQEDRVNLLTDKALDLGTQIYLQKKKETEADAKKIEQGMAALAMTGLDTATRFRIATGGSTAVTNVLNQYNTAIENNKDVDFNTLYSVKDSEEFADMSDKDFISTYGPKATYDPTIAREYLKGRGADGLGGLFVSDPTKLLSEFEAKAGVVGESRVLDTPTLGELTVDMSALGTAIGKDKTKTFDTPKEAITYYTGLIQDEKEKGDKADQSVISLHESRIKAYENIDPEKPTVFKVDERLDAIDKEMVTLAKDPTANATKIAELEAEKAIYLKSKEERAAATRAPDKTVQTLDNMIDTVQLELSQAIIDKAPPSAIAALERKEKVLLNRKRKRVDETAATPAEKDPYTAPQAQTNVKNRIGQMFQGFDFVEVDTMTQKMTLKFGEGRDKYPTFFRGMEIINQGLTRDADAAKSDNLKRQIPAFMDQYNLHLQTYIDKFKDVPNSSYNKSFTTQEDAKKAAQNNELDVGDIVRFTRPDGRKVVTVWTGTAFR